jgi:hypothetical protein
MKIILGLLLAVFAVGVLTARPSYTLESMGWTSKSTIMGSPNFPVVTKKDLLVYFDTRGEPTMAITRRNNEGFYEHVANFTQYYTTLATTNGKWVALLGEGNMLFSVDATNNVSEPSYIYSYGGFLLSDDTFVAYNTDSDGNYTIRTYVYSAAHNNWTSIAGTELFVTTGVTFVGDWSTFKVSDTHLTLTDYTNGGNYTIKIYERLSDRSWSLTDSFAVNSTLEVPGSPIFNGVDTVAYAIPAASNQDEALSYGFVFIYAKVNGQWSLQNTFSATSVGYRAPAYLGWSTVFLDADTLLVSAGLEGYSNSDAGRVLMLKRNTNGVWEEVLDFVGPSNFGLGIGVNDYDLIIPSLNLLSGNSLTFYVTPRCFYQPINVTCNIQQVTDCKDLSSAELYTINNPQCGTITANLLGLSLVNNQALEAQFSFTRDFGSTVYCNATVTCPAPPVTPTSKNVSSADVLQLGLASLFVSVAAILTM